MFLCFPVVQFSAVIELVICQREQIDAVQQPWSLPSMDMAELIRGWLRDATVGGLSLRSAHLTCGIHGRRQDLLLVIPPT